MVVDLVDSDHDDDHGVSGRSLSSSDSGDSAVHMTLRLCGYPVGFGLVKFCWRTPWRKNMLGNLEFQISNAAFKFDHIAGENREERIAS